MKSIKSILLVSDDEVLLRTREALLRRTGAPIVVATSHHAISFQETLICDLVVLCHSIPHDICVSLVIVIHQRWPVTTILLVVPRCATRSECADTAGDEAVSSEPYALLHRVSTLVGGPLPSAGRSRGPQKYAQSSVELALEYAYPPPPQKRIDSATPPLSPKGLLASPSLHPDFPTTFA